MLALSSPGMAQSSSDTKKAGAEAKVAAKAAPTDKEDTSPPAVNPGRPTLTDPASLTAPGWLETEFGLQQDMDRDRNFGSPILFKLTSGNKRLQYRIGMDGYVRLGDRTDGFGDTYAGLNYLAATQDKAGFDIAARTTIKIPTARAALGTKKFDYNVLLLASRDFSPTIHGDFNAGFSSLSRQGVGGTDAQLFLSASFTIPIRGGRWGYTNELTYSSPIYGQRSAVTMMHGLTYAAHRYEVYDIAAQWGLHGDGSTFQVLLGRTFFLGKLF